MPNNYTYRHSEGRRPGGHNGPRPGGGHGHQHGHGHNRDPRLPVIPYGPGIPWWWLPTLWRDR